MRNRVTAFALMTQIVVPALLIIGAVAYAQQSSDKPVISLSTVSKLDRSQAGIYRTKIGKIDVIAVSDGTVGLGLTKELVQNAKPGEVERLLARHFLLASWEGAILRMKVERGPAALDRFRNIVFQTIFKESKNESPL